jgi:hypothetical protein
MLEWKFRLVILLALAGVLAVSLGSLDSLLRFNFGW